MVKRGAVDALDLLALVGVALLASGLWLLHPAGALIVLGALLLAVVVWRAASR